MSLIRVSETVFINSEKISSLESKKDRVLVWVDGRSYTVGVPLKDFINQLGISNQSSGGQHFAG